MGELLLNNELKFTYPEGFHVMTEEERRQQSQPLNGSWEGFSDPERHVIMTVGWKQIPGFSAKLLSGKDIARNSEKYLRKVMKPYGYRLEQYYERTAAGIETNGFSYSYTVQGIAMTGYCYELKRNKSVYYFHFYTRTELKEENQKVLDEILDLAAFA